MQWQTGITILGVFAGNTTQNVQIFFRNQLGVVGWRRVIASAADGVTNIVSCANAAKVSGAPCQLLLTNAGEIAAISTI